MDSALTAPAQPTVVRRLTYGDNATAARWDSFVLDCAEATFFHRSGWQRVICDIFKHRTYFLYAEQRGRIEGVLSLAHVKSLIFGNALVSLPFTVYGGVAANSAEAAVALQAEAEAIAERLAVDYLELRNIGARHPDWSRQNLYVTFRKQILPDLEANLLAIPRKQRAMVRKGINNALTSEIDDGVERFFALFADNVHRHGTPALPKRYFAALQREFGSDCEVLTVVDSAGRPVSSVLSFYFRDEVLPYYAGDAEKARELAANDFKYWEVMRRACVRGCKVFDYGRSKRGTGSYSFKKNWGFEPASLNYEYLLVKGTSVPDHNPLNPKYGRLVQLWRRLPRPLVNFLGPHIVKSLS